MDLAGTTAGRDALAPRRPPGMRLGLALAIGAHVLLILAIAFGVAWKTSEPDGLVGEGRLVQEPHARAGRQQPLGEGGDVRPERGERAQAGDRDGRGARRHAAPALLM